jgi:hypothetical protein
MIGPAELDDLLSESPERFGRLPRHTTDAAAAPDREDERVPRSPVMVDPTLFVCWWLGWWSQAQRPFLCAWTGPRLR